MFVNPTLVVDLFYLWNFKILCFWFEKGCTHTCVSIHPSIQCSVMSGDTPTLTAYTYRKQNFYNNPDRASRPVYYSHWLLVKLSALTRANICHSLFLSIKGVSYNRVSVIFRGTQCHAFTVQVITHESAKSNFSRYLKKCLPRS